MDAFFSGIRVNMVGRSILQGALQDARATILENSDGARMIKVSGADGDRLEQVLRRIATDYKRHNRPLPGFSDRGISLTGTVLDAFLI